MNDFSQLASEQAIANALQALNKNGINAVVVNNQEEARQKVYELIPAGSEVMTQTSVTLDTLGLAKEINESGTWNSARAQFPSLDKSAKQKLGAAPEYTIGSVHAVTEDGKVLVASQTGSQLPAYVYGSAHVIWVVGAQKIVKDVETGTRRIYEYVLPLESERANKAYQITTGSAVNKLLIIHKEYNPKRLHMILVKEKLGF